jgi:hypothetical protein
MPTTTTNGTSALRKRLQDPDTQDALLRLLDRLDTIDRMVDTLERLEAQVPVALTTATDVVDDELTKAASRGVVLDERAREALALAEKLTEPETARALSHLMDRLDQIEELAALADRLPAVVATTADTLDDALTRAADRGVVLDERAREGLRLLEQLTEPQTAQALSAVLGRADQLDDLMQLVDRAPDAIAAVVDMLDAEVAKAYAQGHSPEETLRQTVGALGRLGELFRTDEFQALLDSGVLDPEALNVVGSLGAALVDTQKEAKRGQTPQRGLFGLVGALRDPDVQHALGFLTRFAKKFGQNLRA